MANRWEQVYKYDKKTKSWVVDEKKTQEAVKRNNDYSKSSSASRYGLQKSSTDDVDPISTATASSYTPTKKSEKPAKTYDLNTNVGLDDADKANAALNAQAAGKGMINTINSVPVWTEWQNSVLYKPGSSYTIKNNPMYSDIGYAKSEQDINRQWMMDGHEYLNLSDEDFKTLMSKYDKAMGYTDSTWRLLNARVGNEHVIDQATNWKEKQKLQGAYNLSGYDEVPRQLATNVPEDFKRDGITTYQDLYNKQVAYSRDQMEKDLKTIDSFYNARYAMPGMRFDAEAEQEFADAVSRYEEYSGVDLTNMPADYDGKWIKRMMSSYDADTDMLRGVVEGSEGNWDFDDVYNRDKALLDEQRQKEQADAKGKKFEAEAGEMEAAVQNTEGYADKSQYIPGTQYWMPGSDDYNILAGGSMPSPEDTTSWEERNNRVRYSFINDFLAAVEAKDDATISDMREIAGNLGALDGYDLDAMTNMDEDQIKTAFAYINGNNYQGFEDYMRKINYDLSRKSYEKWEEAEQLKAQGRNFWEHMGASITTWPQNVLASASGLTNDISAWLEKFGIDIRDPYLEHEFSNYNRWGADVDIIRGGADQYIRDNTWSVPENIPIIGGFNPSGTLYQGAMSLGDVGLARLAGDWLGGSLGLAGKAAKKFSQFVSGLHMFGIEAGRSLQEAMAAGQDNAALKATGDATLSAIFENIGLDKVLSGNLLKAAIGEGSEEFFTGATQMVWDALLNREDSKPAKLLDKYRIMGYASKAEFAAALDTAADLFEQFMSGFSAGDVGGVTPAVTNQVQNVKSGRTIQQYDTAQPILDLAATLDLEPSVLQLVQEQQAALDAMKASQQESEAQSEEDQDNLDDESAIESEEEDQEAEVLPERGEYEFDGNESTLTPVANEQEAEKLPNREEAMPDGRESTLTPAEEQQQEAEKLLNREENQPDGRESTLTPANEQRQEAEKLSERETTMPDGESTLTPASEENAPAAEEAGDVSEAAEDMAEAAEDAAESPAPKKGKKVKVPKVSNAKLGRIYREALAKLDERAQDVLRKSFETEISQQLQERGFKGDPRTTAEAISKMVSGDASMITPEVVMAVSSDRMVLEIVNDFTAPIRDFQRMAALGAGGIPAIAAKNVKGKYSTANGQRFVPERIVSISDDGKVRVTGKTVHGEVMTVDADSIDFGINDGGIEIVADVAGILGRNADALLNNMQGSQDPVKYALAFKAAMEYGQNGRSLSSAKSDTSLSTLTESQIEIAHSLGKDILEKGGRKPKKNISGISVGNVDTSAISGVKLSKQQKASINAMTRLAKVVGFNVKFVKSKADADGKYKTENGSWESSTMTLTLDIHAGSNETTDLNYAMMHTAGHELTHFIKDFADAGLWNDYQEFVMDHLYEKMSDAEIEERIKDHIKRAEKRGETMTRDGALEEVIADASGEALMNITEADLRQIAQSNPTLFGRIKQFFKKWLSDLKTNIDIAYSGNQNKTAETKAMHDVVDQLSEKWNKLFVNAAQNKAVASEATNADTTVEAAIMEAAGDAVNTDGNKLFSLRTMQEDKDEFRSMLIKHGKMSATEITKLFNTIDHLMDEIEDNRHILDFGENIDSDKRSFTPVKPNSDPLYQVSVDFSTLCRKRLLQQVCQERLEAAMGRAVTKAERVAIRDELIKLQQQGKQIEVACALCYVESARLKSPAQIQRFMDNRAEVIRNYYARRNEGVKAAMQTAEAEYRRANNLGDQSLKNLPGTVAKKVRAAKNAPIANYRVSAQEQKTIDKAMSMSVSDFTSAESLWKLKRSDPELFDIYTSYIRNATKSKGIEGDTPWKAGDSKTISDELIRKMNQENGLRSQSWSDFQTYHILDYIAAVIELSTRDAKMQVYTKVPAYVKLMGETGAMINMSLIPAAKFDGTLQYDDVEGFAHEQAFELRKRYPDTAGTICIGIDDKQIDMLLENDDIDYVIPYHRSGMDAATRRKMRIPTWHDYESQQNEKALSKDAGKAPKFSEWFDYKTATEEAQEANNTDEGKAAIAAGDVMYGAKIAMQNAAQRYMNLCAERNLAPKFQKFTGNQGYWKLLIDRKMINNITGEIIEQKALQPVFKEGTLIKICQDEVSKFNQTNADFQYAVDAVLDAYESGTLGKVAKSEKVQQAVRDHENWMAVQAAIGFQEQAVEGKRFSSRDVDGDFSNDFNTRGIQWVYDEYLLSREQQRQFHDAHREISHRRYNSFQKTSDGEYIIPVDGAIIFSNGQYKNPSISAIIRLNVSDPAETIAMIGEALNNGKRSGHFDKHQAWAIIDAVFKDGSAEFFHRRIRGKDTDVEYRRSGDNSREADYAGEAWRSEESVDDSTRYQERDLSQLSDRELLANAVESVAQNDTERDYIKRYKKHIAELNEKQLAMQEAEEQIRELKAEDAKGNRDEIIKLQNKVDIYAKQISRADAKLLDYEATKPIKDMLTREKAEYKRKRDARAKEQMARYRENQHQRTLDRIREVREAEANKRKAMRERADERQRKAVEHAREVGQRKVDRMKESQGKEKYRAQILQDAKKLYGWVVSPTNKGHVPAFLREPLAGFIESIDFTSARQLKGGDPTKNDARFEKALDKLRDAIGDINKQQSDIDGGAATFAGYIDLPSDYMDEFNTLVRNIKTTLEISEGAVDTPFNRMTADQLHEMSKMFRILNSSISKMNQLVANGRYESAKTASNDTIADMNAMNAKVKTNKVLSTLNTMFNWKNTTPYYAFQRLGRGGKAIFEGLQDGWDKMAQNSKKLIEYAEDAFTPQQAKAWSKDIKTIELDSGEKFQMTASQAMSLYCLSKRQQAIGHLKGGGIRVSDIDAGKGNTISQVDNYILSEADISRIIGTLTAEQKGVADKLQRFMNTVCTEWGNEISMKRFGYEMFTEDNYFPIETDANNRSRIDDKQDGNNSMFRLLNMSAMKQLTPNANNAIIIRDIFDVFSNHASDIGKYNALALPILDFIKWYNFVEKSEVLDADGKPTGQIITRSTQKALERAFGQDAKTYLMSFIKDLNAEHDGGRNDTVLSKLMGHAKAGSVSANMRVAFLQITSLPRAAYAIDPKYLLKGMAKVKSLNPATAIKGSEAQENIGILKWKNLGFYSTDVSRSTRSMVRRDEGVITKIRDLVMKPAEWGDNWTSNIIYEAAKAEIADKHPNAKPGTKAYDAMLNKRVREIVYKTQVVDSTMTRSDFMRSKGLMTAFTAFMSEPTLTVNMLNESIQEAVANARTGMSARENLRSVGGKAVRAATVMAFTATAAALVESLFDALRDDDDYEEFQEKFADAFGGNIVDNVNVFAMLPILKDAISVMQGYENSSMVTQVVSQYKDVQEAITAWQEGKRPIYSVIYNMLKVAASATGVGVQSATRDAVGLYNTFLADAFDTPKIQTYSDSKSKAAEEFYEALQAGDKEKAEWIMQRAEINGIALPDISDKIATLVKNEFVAGDINEEEATRRLIEYGGKDENEAYWKIQEWGYSGEGNFSKYTGLKDALKSGDRAAANAARDELVEHGASEQAISGQLSEIYNNGEATSILNLQMRSDSLYTSSLKLKADGEAHPDDFDAFITAIVNGGNISGEIDALMDKGYTVKQCMSAINGAFGKSKDTYRIMETNNSSDAGILLDRILDAYEYLGLDRAEEIAWIDANWIM